MFGCRVKLANVLVSHGHGTPEQLDLLSGQAGEQRRVPGLQTVKQLNRKLPWAPPKLMANFKNLPAAMSCLAWLHTNRSLQTQPCPTRQHTLPSPPVHVGCIHQPCGAHAYWNTRAMSLYL